MRQIDIFDFLFLDAFWAMGRYQCDPAMKTWVGSWVLAELNGSQRPQQPSVGIGKTEMVAHMVFCVTSLIPAIGRPFWPFKSQGFASSFSPQQRNTKWTDPQDLSGQKRPLMRDSEPGL
jgi:hypothetical protein